MSKGTDALKAVGAGLVGAGVTLVATWGLGKVSSITPTMAAGIVAAVGVAAAVGAAWMGKPIIGIAIAAPMFFYSGTIAWAKMKSPAQLMADAVAATRAMAGLPAQTPAAVQTPAPGATAPATYPLPFVGAY